MRRSADGPVPERRLSRAEQRLERSRARSSTSRGDHIERTQLVIAHTHERLAAVRVRLPQGC